MRDAQAADRQRLLAVSGSAAVGLSQRAAKAPGNHLLVYALVVNRAAGVQRVVRSLRADVHGLLSATY
ncbi:MAG: hypothetical protein ACRDRK_27165 [Pseudonocardia sp.]